MKIGLVSLGCPKNLVDSEVMLGLAREAGHELTQDASAADVLVVNTCAFIDAAKQESVETILEMARFKTDGACRRLIVAGCLAERYRNELPKEIPEVDAVLGTGEVPDIVRAIGGGSSVARGEPVTFFRSSSGPVVSGPSAIAPDATAPILIEQSRPVVTPPSYLYDADTPRLRATPKHYAYMKVAEGCDYTCAFCIIPTLRGSYRSRPIESLVREAHRLAAQGVRELLLISQDTSFYGVDRGERGGLARLLRALNDVDGLEWIRVLYLYPTTIDDATLAAMTECGKVCRYVDLPLQHAADPVLKRMGRPGTRRAYEALLDRIRLRVPGVAVRTTFIVGFPGETEGDMADLASFVREQAFDHVGVFTYSHEEGTRAFAFADDIPATAKQARRRTIMSLQRRIVQVRQRGRRGKRVQVRVDGPTGDHDLVWKGRLASQAPDIDPVAYFTDVDPSGLKPGALVEAEVVGSRNYDLIVRPIEGR